MGLFRCILARSFFSSARKASGKLNDYWGALVGLLIGGWGVWGLLTGRITIYYTPRHNAMRARPIYTYEGYGLPVVLVIIGALLLGLYYLSHGPVQRLTIQRANSYAGYILVGGFIVAILVCVFQGVFVRSSSPAQRHKVNTVSLNEAAGIVNMPESRLLEMAQNGGIQAHRIDGEYRFEPEILYAFRDTMDRLDD
jgi:hypothetical protein